MLQDPSEDTAANSRTAREPDQMARHLDDTPKLATGPDAQNGFRRSDTCISYRLTIGQDTRGPSDGSEDRARAPPGAVDRRLTGRDVLLREKCGPPRPA